MGRHNTQRGFDKINLVKPMCYWHEIDLWKDVSPAEWSDWRWQLRSVIRSPKELKDALKERAFVIDQPEALSNVVDTFEMKITPHVIATAYHALKTGESRAANVLANTFVPSLAEIESINNGIDGIGEESRESKPAPLITNFYQNRVLLFVTNTCSSYCRYCFRRRKVGKHLDNITEPRISEELLQKSIQYVRDNRKIKEVIISGGDPFILSDRKLLSILQQLRDIEHVDVLRVDTKVFTTLPQRITKELVKGLKQLKPLYVVGNFLHSTELGPDTIKATSLLIDGGIPVSSHTALLRGINDDSKTISELMWNLYRNRIVPYYLIQFIPTKWTQHFRVPIQRGLKIMRDLNGHLSGIANPTYIVYLPNGAGKVPISPNYLLEHTNDGYYFENFEGRKVLYKEPLDS